MTILEYPDIGEGKSLRKLRENRIRIPCAWINSLPRILNYN